MPAYINNYQNKPPFAAKVHVLQHRTPKIYLKIYNEHICNTLKNYLHKKKQETNQKYQYLNPKLRDFTSLNR